MSSNPAVKYIFLPCLLGFSATQAIVMPPISESLKRSRKVPFGLDISMSCACCLFTNPRIALKLHPEVCQTTQEKKKSFKLMMAVKNRLIMLHFRKHLVNHSSLPIIPVRLQMFLHEFYHSIKPLPKSEVASW